MEMYERAQAETNSAGYTLKGFVQALLQLNELHGATAELATKYVAAHDAAHQKQLDAIGADK